MGNLLLHCLVANRDRIRGYDLNGRDTDDPEVMTKTDGDVMYPPRDEYIYRMMYEVNMDRYDHFKDDLKVLGNNAEEMIRQVIATCAWAYEYYHLTGCIEDPYIPYLLWSPTPTVDHWRTPTRRLGRCENYCAEIKKNW